MEKKIVYFLAISSLVLTGFVAGKHLGGGTRHAQHQDNVEVVDSGQKKKIIYWRAPMDPGFISNAPGKSPMGMDLVPVYEGDEESSGRGIKINPEVVQNMGVRTGRVVKKQLEKVIRTLGHLDYNERNVGVVTTRVNGWIEKLYADFTGKQIKKGDPLFDIYSPELVSAQEELLLAVASGRKTLERSARKRLSYWEISKKQINNIIRRKKVSKTLTIYSPFDGVVIEKHVEQGAFVKSDRNLFKIADLSSIWVYVHVYEYELPWIKQGQTAAMELSYIPGKKFIGKVAYIYPYLDSKTRDIKIRLEFKNKDLELKPQMYANIRIHSKINDSVLAIPEEAVIDTGERQVVFISLGEGRFQARELKLGAVADEGWVSVLSGLSEGEIVVRSGQFLLDSESKLKEAIAKLLDVDNVSDAKQGMDHSGMDHSKMNHASGAKQDMDHSDMDHSKMNHASGAKQDMDHSGMDHSKMNHASGAKSEMDHSDMDHSKMNHASGAKQEMDHSDMDHSKMNHASGVKQEMDHSGMDHSSH